MLDTASVLTYWVVAIYVLAANEGERDVQKLSVTNMFSWILFRIPF
jgi:hypothetical protein